MAKPKKPLPTPQLPPNVDMLVLLWCAKRKGEAQEAPLTERVAEYMKDPGAVFEALGMRGLIVAKVARDGNRAWALTRAGYAYLKREFPQEGRDWTCGS